MGTEVLVNPYVFYQAPDRLEPVRNSHVYVDLPTDKEGFLHARTDVNGRLCNVAQERRGARGAGPLFVPLEREKPFAIYLDDGVVPPEGLPHLGASAHQVKLEERAEGGRQQAFFRVPIRPFDIVVELLEVSFIDGWDAGPRDEATGALSRKPAGTAESVDPFPPKPVVYFRAKSAKGPPADPPRKPPSQLRILDIAFRGFPADEPALRIDAARLGLDVPPDYLKRVMAQAIYEEAHLSCRSSLDQDAHAFIKRRYARIDTAVCEWRKRLGRDPGRNLVAAGERDANVWDLYARRPARRVFDWQPDFLDQLWLVFELDPAARVTPDLELDSWVTGRRCRRPRKLIDILVHNRQVLGLDALIAQVGDWGGGQLASAILERNVDQGVTDWLPALREACEAPLQQTERFAEYARKLRLDPTAFPPIAPGADHLPDTRAYLAFLDRERRAPFAPDPAYVNGLARAAVRDGSAPALLRVHTEGLWRELAMLARGFRKQAEELATRWSVLEGRVTAETRIDRGLAERCIYAHAESARLRCGLARMQRLAADRLQAIQTAWVKKLGRHDEALALSGKAKRQDLHEILAGWEAERVHFTAVALTRCSEALAAWTAALGQAEAALGHAAKVAEAARARALGAPAGQPAGDALAKAVGDAEQAAGASARKVDEAADAEATGGERPQHGNAERTAADVLWALAITRCEEIMEVYRLAHYQGAV